MIKWPSNIKRQLRILWMNQLSLLHVGDADGNVSVIFL